MPLVSSPLGTANPAIPLVNATELGKAAGLHQHYPTLAALNAAVVAERANVTAASAMWQEGQLFTVGAESADVFRAWSVAGNHARKVNVRPGLAVVLAADANTVLFGAGAPSAGTGSDGDISIDWTGGKIYTKGGGAWVVSQAAIYTAAAIATQELSVTLADANVVLAPGVNANVLTKSSSATARTHTFTNSGWAVDQEVTIDVRGAGAVTVAPAVNAAAVGGVTVKGSATLTTAGTQYDTMQFVVDAATANTVTFVRRA
jgi:hypothetical protein